MDTKALADKLMGDAAHLREVFRAARGSLRGTIRQIPAVVEAVERLAKDTQLVGDQKREVAVIILNRLIDLPWIPEKVEAVLFGLVVDAVVAAYNRFGHGWMSKLGL